MNRASAWIAVCALFAGCGDDDVASCPEGTDGCACLGDDTCLDGLECDDGACAPATGDGGSISADGGVRPDARVPAAGSGAIEDAALTEAGPEPTTDAGETPVDDAGPDAHADAGPPMCEDTCDEHATCTRTDDGDVCVCGAGFEGPGILCTDVDECADGTHDCDAHASCDNTVGGFTCTCDEYYFGPGRACAPIDPGTFVRDVSSAPIEWDVTGVGTFRVHGMSRLAWDIEVIETPATPPRVLKDAGAIRIPAVTLARLEPLGASLGALAAWAVDATPRAVRVQLDGLRGERLLVDLTGVVPVSADVTESDGKLARVTVAVASMALGQSFPPQSSTPPAPSTFVEIEGVTFDVAFLPPDIDKLADGQHGSVRLREVPNHRDGRQAEALITWMQGTIRDLGTDPPFIQRRAMSLIERTGPDPADEVRRVNCYEGWPHELYLFNPAKRYPTAYLVDVSIATEYCEDG